LTLVAEANGAVAGYVVGRYAADEAEILDLAVREDLRRRGVAKALVGAVAERAGRLGLSRVYLEVRESNVAALGLYQSSGFKPVGRRRTYYHDPTEDALLLALDIGEFSGSA
jgi:ribosomal-protein-alanine N-acetyltransferase